MFVYGHFMTLCNYAPLQIANRNLNALYYFTHFLHIPLKRTKSHFKLLYISSVDFYDLNYKSRLRSFCELVRIAYRLRLGRLKLFYRAGVELEGVRDIEKIASKSCDEGRSRNLHKICTLRWFKRKEHDTLRLGAFIFFTYSLYPRGVLSRRA